MRKGTNLLMSMGKYNAGLQTQQQPPRTGIHEFEDEWEVGDCMDTACDGRYAIVKGGVKSREIELVQAVAERVLCHHIVGHASKSLSQRENDVLVCIRFLDLGVQLLAFGQDVRP